MEFSAKGLPEPTSSILPRASLLFHEPTEPDPTSGSLNLLFLLSGHLFSQVFTRPPLILSHLSFLCANATWLVKLPFLSPTEQITSLGFPTFLYATFFSIGYVAMEHTLYGTSLLHSTRGQGFLFSFLLYLLSNTHLGAHGRLKKNLLSEWRKDREGSWLSLLHNSLLHIC